MRTKLAMFLVLAGGVAGCASNPPPPPPMAMAPEPAPAPAPAPMTPDAMNGTYKGAVEASADNGPRCHKMTTATATVRGKTFKVGAMTGRIGDDGALTSAGKKGGTVTGTLANGTLDLNSTVGKCSYHYTLNHA